MTITLRLQFHRRRWTPQGPLYTPGRPWLDELVTDGFDEATSGMMRAIEANWEVRAVSGRRFDVVYTGKGALVYVPDLDRWARVVADLPRPGGIVYVVEFHPLLAALGPVPTADEGPDLVLRHDYLGGGGLPDDEPRIPLMYGLRATAGGPAIEPRSR